MIEDTEGKTGATTSLALSGGGTVCCKDPQQECGHSSEVHV